MKTFDGIININYLTPETAKFERVNEFVSCTLLGEQEVNHPKVSLRRAFPYEFECEFISILDPDDKELGMIRDIAIFPEEVRELLVNELERRYYTLKITKITQFKERHGFSYWKCETNRGPAEFTLRDTFRSIYKISSGHIAITDVDGNRYEIPDVSKLDKASYKKIDIYT